MAEDEPHLRVRSIGCTLGEDELPFALTERSGRLGIERNVVEGFESIERMIKNWEAEGRSQSSG